MAHHPLKAITLTHVRYPRGDKIGCFLAWISLIPVFISLGGFVAHFFFRRELQGMFFALGLVISQIISESIKSCVQQSRPETCALLEVCESHGWPSSHSQYMFFFATYFTLLSYRKAGFFGGNENNWIVETVAWLSAVLTMFSRVYLGYHTVGQVCAGAFFGTVLAGSWYWIVNNVFIHVFPFIEESYIGRKFYIKDTSHICNVLKFEYDNARAARKDMADKSN
ncbi:hypothetical protein BVRB_7g179770 [Beta vulgaris subsp. vulgaris]|uniref:Phosphatidic acid phosphatase type 2/haloperoxidase domain-containing protein n=1 Tax=Beta vulgaris subsp. vulgaris TaxID=3555 RepID=A0A0J8B6T2_BETVV|nr:lipid phosphate phosphatase gamma [Beta vulgaris subsp. vulgaris]XP_010696398.1 lipid phosphate phosphatase gamma [Beta vulgaris subsp. vulgaris]KMS96969.1 hypothetical protein BVRB_7g179770 [Beta vulgaris subsp. vulgaris]